MKSIIHIETTDEERAAIGQHLHGRKVLATRRDVTHCIEAMWESFVAKVLGSEPEPRAASPDEHPGGDLIPGRLEPENGKVAEALTQLQRLGYAPIGRYQGDLVVQYRGDDEHHQRVHQRIDSAGVIHLCRSGSYRRAPGAYRQ